MRIPVLVHDRRTGRAIPRLRITGEDGLPISGRDLEVVPGPGAAKATMERYQRASSPPRPERAQRRSAAGAAG